MTRRLVLLHGVFLSVSILMATGCYTAAPVRTTGYGAPGRLQDGQMELAVGGTTFLSGGAFLGLAVTDWMSVELTSDFGYGAWAMGGLALRFNPVRPDGEGVALDLELGGGLGAGYLSSGPDVCIEGACGSNDPNWRDVLSYGGYAGTGFGWWVLDWLAIYLRARAGFNGSDEASYAVFAEARMGIEFRFKKGAYLYIAGGGYLAFIEENMGHTYYGPILEIGLSVPFPVMK